MVFNCSICDNSYNSSRALRRHVNEKHDKTRFKCICGKDFSRKFTLNKHMNNCMEGNNSILNRDVLSGGEGSVAQSSVNKLNSVNDISKSMSETNNNLSDSPNDENEADEESDGEIISKPRVNRYRSRKPKMSYDSSEEDEVVPRPRKRRIRNSLNSQNGSGTDSDRLKFNKVSDIFSKRNSVETDSNSSDESYSKHSKLCYCRNCYSGKKSRNCKYVHSKKEKLNDQSKEGNNSEESSSNESDSEQSKLCYCRNCYSAKKSRNCKYVHSKKEKTDDQSEEGNDSEESSSDEFDSEQSKLCYCRNCYSAKKSGNCKYVHSKKEKSDDQSEGRNDSEMDEVKESDEETEIDEGFNPYNQYYKSQASGGGIFSTIIGNSNQTGNIGGGLSSLYRSSTVFPIGKIIGNTIKKPVSSYLT